MTALKRLSYLTLALALTHVVFGAIVRISGSGLGCGENWPRCYGHWFPPLDHPTIVIEWSHRLLAALLTTAIVVLAAVAFAKRTEPGVGGRGGVSRATGLAVVIVIITAIFGAITVKLGNAWYATLGHWFLAATLLATLVCTAIRAGGLGGAAAQSQRGSARAMRGSTAGAGIALVTVLMGGMTATYPGASVACLGFPLCSGQLLPALPTQHIQWTHRLLAFLLFFHVLGLLVGFTRRHEAPVVLRAVRVAFGLILLQIGIAAVMVELHLPAAWRSLHQANGVLVWLALVSLAYLARVVSRHAEAPEPLGVTGTERATAPASVHLPEVTS
ncbi:MAG TPA: COX15/CtaA family protein [Gemmatimonadaceae bacterium]